MEFYKKDISELFYSLSKEERVSLIEGVIKLVKSEPNDSDLGKGVNVFVKSFFDKEQQVFYNLLIFIVMKKIKITETQYKRLIVTEQSKVDKEFQNRIRNEVRGFKNQGYKRMTGFVNDMINNYPAQSIKKYEFSMSNSEIYPDDTFKKHMKSYGGNNIKEFASFRKGNKYVYFYVAG